MAEKERILVLDQDEPVAEIVSRIAIQMGHEILTVKDGKEARELLRKGSITLLIVDLQVPGLNGLEGIKSLRAEFPDLPILCMMTESGSPSDVDEVVSGLTGTIAKPFALNEMRGKLGRLIYEKNLIGDLTKKSIELERVNEELKRVEQLKSDFILGISNELRTPLTVIKEVFSLVLEERIGTLTDDQKEYLGIANKNILRLGSMIDALQNFSRIESGKELKLKFEPVRLNAVIDEAWMTLSQPLEEKKITFENRLDPETPVIFGDRSRLIEVFVNLMDHALKSTPSGGKITIDSRGLTEGRDYLKVILTEMGRSLSPEALVNVFDRFSQGQKIQDGIGLVTGLGLAVAKEIIEAHQGVIQAESRPGNGNAFIFTLPVFGVDTIFTLLIQPMLTKAEEDKLNFSMIQMEFWDQRTKRETALTDGVLEGVVYAIKMMVRSMDVVLPFQGSRVYIFAYVDKKLAKEIGERIQTKSVQGGYVPKGINVQFRTYSFPKDARNRDDFVKGCRLYLKEE
ncbi:MAG: ATP-binding protein [Thermodesulfobacteriota bacterium]